MNTDKVKSFWNWFAKNESDLFPDRISDDLINVLDRKILSLGNFSWEIREGEIRENMLIISPDGDLDLLNKTKEIIQKAPDLRSWEFHYYKPAKQWDFKFSIEDSKGFKRLIDVSSWEYVLLKYPDNTYDSILKVAGINDLSIETQNSLADMVLESILGEKLSLSLIKNVEIVEYFSKEDESKKSSILSLKEHLLSL